MWTEPILHVDMDSFFVEVERRLDPSLIGRPVAVGGKGARGVIASASYEARRYGVHSAQPTTTAARLCPNLIVVPPTHGRYGEWSARVFAIFRDFTPLVEGVSLDEAFLDVGGLRLHFDSAVAVGKEIRARIRSKLGLPASVGVAATKLVAKLASEAAKPDGLRHVPRESQLAFLHALPAEALWGVGPATLAGLKRLGVDTVVDVANLPLPALSQTFGPALGRHLHDLAHGIDPRPVEPDSVSKSISVEETYEQDLEGAEVIEAALLAHAHRLSMRLRRDGMAARTITLKVRYHDFNTVTRSQTLKEAIDSFRDLYRVGRALTRHVELDRPVRLLGLGASLLEGGNGPRQPELDSHDDWDRFEEAVAEVRDRYGDSALSPARLLDRTNTTSEKDP